MSSTLISSKRLSLFNRICDTPVYQALKSETTCSNRRAVIFKVVRENKVRTIFGIFQFALVATHCDINLFKIHNGNTRTRLLIKTPERRQ